MLGTNIENSLLMYRNCFFVSTKIGIYGTVNFVILRLLCVNVTSYVISKVLIGKQLIHDLFKVPPFLAICVDVTNFKGKNC